MVNIAIILGFVLLIIYTIIFIEFLSAPDEDEFIEQNVYKQIAFLKSQPQTKNIKLQIQKLQQKL
mgnify:CR=1 FL=1